MNAAKSIARAVGRSLMRRSSRASPAREGEALEVRPKTRRARRAGSGRPAGAGGIGCKVWKDPLVTHVLIAFFIIKS